MDNMERARKEIELDGADAYAFAANLVGADTADELLTELILKNMRSEGHTPQDGEVEGIVARTRQRKGF